MQSTSLVQDVNQQFSPHDCQSERAGLEKIIKSKTLKTCQFHTLLINFETVTWGSVKRWPSLRHTCPRDLIILFHRLTWLQHPIS